ncbi:hypothetical protein JHK87_012022 [Glycine soja]|nr:hypothetical protein JHK87_012022 [Glycine soja]
MLLCRADVHILTLRHLTPHLWTLDSTKSPQALSQTFWRKSLSNVEGGNLDKFKGCGLVKPPSMDKRCLGQIEARVDPSSASDIDEDEVVEVTLDVPLLAPTKRKRNEGVEGSSQRKKSRGPFSL